MKSDEIISKLENKLSKVEIYNYVLKNKVHFTSVICGCWNHRRKLRLRYKNMY